MKLNKGTIVHLNGIPVQLQEDVEAWTSEPNQRLIDERGAGNTTNRYVQMTKERAKVIMEGLAVMFSESQGNCDFAAEDGLRRELETLYPKLKKEYSYIPYNETPGKHERIPLTDAEFEMWKHRLGNPPAIHEVTQQEDEFRMTYQETVNADEQQRRDCD